MANKTDLVNSVAELADLSKKRSESSRSCIRNYSNFFI